jgi:phosphonopyruvate decarboxylase
MIDSKKFISILTKSKIEYFTGVPDSVLNSFIKDLNQVKKIEHNPTINEGSAIGLGVGYYLSTKKIPLIYMQNSGLCNALNPILSLADEMVFSIPQIILVGRRGAPGIKDEPQHAKIGPKTLNLLKSLDLRFFDLNKCNNFKEIEKDVKNSISNAKKYNKPVFLIVNKNFFKSKKSEKKTIKKSQLPKRITFLDCLLKNKKNKDSIFFSSLGNASREIFHLNTISKRNHNRFFYTIGGMGHVSQIAITFKQFQKKKEVVIIDGDGSIQMQLGNLLKIGKSNLKILHIVFDNSCHESTGGHELGVSNPNYEKLFKAFGYKYVKIIRSLKVFNKEINKRFTKTKALIIKIQPGTIPHLPRPNITANKLKKIFIS